MHGYGRIMGLLMVAALAAGCHGHSRSGLPFDAMYEALRARQCLEQEGMAFCDDYFENSYQTYQQERQRYLREMKEQAAD